MSRNTILEEIPYLHNFTFLDDNRDLYTGLDTPFHEIEYLYDEDLYNSTTKERIRDHFSERFLIFKNHFLLNHIDELEITRYYFEMQILNDQNITIHRMPDCYYQSPFIEETRLLPSCIENFEESYFEGEDEVWGDKTIRSPYRVLFYVKLFFDTTPGIDRSELYTRIEESEEDNNNEIFTSEEEIEVRPQEEYEAPQQQTKIELKQSIKVEECVICLKTQPNVIYNLCGHIPTCKECEDRGEISTCPLCRARVTTKYIINHNLIK